MSLGNQTFNEAPTGEAYQKKEKSNDQGGKSGQDHRETQGGTESRSGRERIYCMRETESEREEGGTKRDRERKSSEGTYEEGKRGKEHIERAFSSTG